MNLVLEEGSTTNYIIEKLANLENVRQEIGWVENSSLVEIVRDA